MKDFDSLIEYLFTNLDVLWTFLLLLCRFTGLLIILPGIGRGITGLAVRGPAIFAFSFVSMSSVRIAPLPTDLAVMATSIFMEAFLGFVIGVIPYIIVSGVEAGAQLATNTMGLSAGQMFDPATGAASTDLSRIQGDLVILVFLFMGGHHIVFEAASGLSGAFTPGYFEFNKFTADLLIDRLESVFKIGIMISAPVIVALLLTQFVLGIVSKAIPTVNIFIVSFPLTIGIGLILSVLALPEVVTYVKRQMTLVEGQISTVIENSTDYRSN